MKRFVLTGQRDYATKWEMIDQMVRNRVLSGGSLEVTLSEPKRTVSQNNKLWPLLRDISRQLMHEDELHDPEFWKDALMAVYRPVRWIEGLDGMRLPFIEGTSKLTAKEFAQFLDVVWAYGTSKGVEWSREATDSYTRWKS